VGGEGGGISCAGQKNRGRTQNARGKKKKKLGKRVKAGSNTKGKGRPRRTPKKGAEKRRAFCVASKKKGGLEKGCGGVEGEGGPFEFGQKSSD